MQINREKADAVVDDFDYLAEIDAVPYSSGMFCRYGWLRGKR